MVAGVETPEEIARPRQRGHGACGNGAANAGVALTAPLVPSPIGVSVALPIGSAIVPPAFCRTLVRRGAFLRSMCFPPFSTMYRPVSSAIRHEEQRSRSRQIFGRILRQNFAVG